MNKIKLYFVKKSTWFDKNGPARMSLNTDDDVINHISNKFKDSYEEVLKNNFNLKVIKADVKLNIEGLGLYLLDSGDDYGHIRSFSALGVFIHGCKVVEFNLEAYNMDKAIKLAIQIYNEFADEK